MAIFGHRLVGLCRSGGGGNESGGDDKGLKATHHVKSFCSTSDPPPLARANGRENLPKKAVGALYGKVKLFSTPERIPQGEAMGL
jgi:hypothetical protein